MFFGVLWGVGGLTFGLSMRYLGVALGQSVALGTCAGLGTILTPVFTGKTDDLTTPVVVGVVVTLLGIGIIGYALYAYAIGHTIPGWTSLLVSLWFIGGAILTAIGIIGEYIGKIYKEVKRRPRYFIEKQITE